MIYRFGTCLLDTRRALLTRDDLAIPIEPQVFALLALLVEQADRLVTKDEIIAAVWKGRIVSDAALNSRVSAARRAIGDDGEAQAMLQTVRGRGFRFVVPVETLNGVAAAVRSPPRQQVVRYGRTQDGVSIAYAVSGEGPRILRAANWLSHLEYERESPLWQHLIEVLGRGRQLIRYDRRGCGLSERACEGFGFEESLWDIEAVAEQLGPGPFDLVGLSGGCATAIAYAARHPERVRRLVLVGASPQGWHHRTTAELATRQALVTLTREGWGKDNPAFRQIFTSMMFPDATAEQARWFNELQRRSSSPETAAKIMDAFGHYDVTDLLGRVQCPTLVLHSTDDAMVSVDLGRRVAAGIPGAQFVTLFSRSHLALENEPAWAVMDAEIQAFLSG